MQPLKFIFCVLLSLPVQAEIYKCSIDSKTTYQSTPCQTVQQQEQIPIKQTDPASIEAAQLELARKLEADNNGSSATTERGDDGRIKRSEAAKDDFKQANPCPSNGRRSGPCPGYVIDHINPLACGGADDPGNMQWQTMEAAKEKDKWERDGCEGKAVKQEIFKPQRETSLGGPSGTGQRGGLQRGKKGGCSYINSNGNRVWVERSACN